VRLPRRPHLEQVAATFLSEEHGRAGGCVRNHPSRDEHRTLSERGTLGTLLLLGSGGAWTASARRDPQLRREVSPVRKRAGLASHPQIAGARGLLADALRKRGR